MNLTQIIRTVGDEISSVIDDLSIRGITVAGVDAEIEMHAIGMEGAAEFTRTVKVHGLTNRLINSGALMQANDQRERRVAAAKDVGILTELNGGLPFARRFGSASRPQVLDSRKNQSGTTRPQ